MHSPVATHDDGIIKLNLVLGCWCIIATGSVEAFYLWRLFMCRRANLSWFHRAWRGQCSGQLEIAAQVITSLSDVGMRLVNSSRV